VAMRAITVVPGRRGSVALTEMPEPPLDDGPVVVRTQAIGICGTDLEIINGDYGSAPPGQERLIIGHESLGRVAEAGPGTGFSAGDLVVGIVRRRDPVPRTLCCSVRSTPAGSTTSSPPGRSPRPTRAGSPASSPARCPSTDGATPTVAGQMTSRPS